MNRDDLRKHMDEIGATGDPAWEQLYNLAEEFEAILDERGIPRAIPIFKLPKYFHRDGQPILSNELLSDFAQWALMFEDTKARIVGSTQTLYGERLSTVWLGLEHGYNRGKPLIFESMLFAPEEHDERAYPHDQLQARYATEEEARDAHHTLKLQCLIPPRWRHFLLWTIGRDHNWSFYGDQEDTWS
jgi:hypothetical protein